MGEQTTTNLSEEDLTRILEQKSSLSKKLVLSLEVALNALSASGRYPFFETVELSHFTAPDGKKLGALEHLNFGQLVEEGTAEICLHRLMGPTRVKRLVAIIENLIEGEAEGEEESGESTSHDLPGFVTGIISGGSQRTDFRMKHLRKDVPVFGSVEAEKRLSEAIRKLRSCSELEKFRHMKLGEYWDPTITSAPFIEDLTVGELVDINIDVLLKKRSFGNRKIFALLGAIDTCLSRESRVEKPTEIATVVDFKSATENVRASSPGIPEKVIWRESSNDLPAFSKGILLYVQRAVNETPSDHGSCIRILRTAVREMLPEQFISLWLRCELENELELKLTGCRLDEQESVLSSARVKFLDIVRREASAVLDGWDSMLQSPAVPEEKIFLTLSDSQLDDILVHTVGKMVLSVSGAQVVEAFGYSLSGYWTKRPQSFELVLNTLVKGMPKSADILSQELAALLPFVLQEHLEPILATVANYDKKSGNWTVK